MSSTDEQKPVVNQRENFRLELGNHVLGSMSIYKIGDKVIDTAKTDVCVVDLGAGGIKFRTSLNIPMKNEVLLSVDMNLLDQSFSMLGYIVRKINNDDGTFDYGLKSIADEDEKTPWVKVLNNLIVMQAKTPWKLRYVACKCELSITNEEGIKP